MLHRPLTGLSRSKGAGTYAVRTLAMVTAGWLAGIGSGIAASPHYSLPYTFAAAPSGTEIRNPQAIILGAHGNLVGVGTGGGYWGVGGVFSTRDGKFADSERDFDNLRGSDLSVGWIQSPELPNNNFSPLALMPNGGYTVVTNTGGRSLTGQPDKNPDGMAFWQSDSGASYPVYAFFPDAGDVTRPQSIALGSDGYLYGYAAGGTSSGGFKTSNSNLFRLSEGYSVNLFNFKSYSPTSFALGADDDMYVSLPKGVELVENGNASAGDVIYKVTKDGVGSVVHVLDSDTEGHGIDELVSDSQGNLFGAALLGGSSGNGDGTVFRVSASGEFSVLHSFRNNVATGAQGYWPNSLVAGSDGNLYGMTRTGGASPNFNGTLFRISPSGAYTVLHSFGTAQADGSNARSLIQGGPRTFYGVVDGGPNASGAIFKLVVPIQDDVSGSGKSSLLLSGPGALSIGTTTEVGRTFDISAGYFPVATGDLNGDGIADIVWSSANHDLYVWFGGVNGFQSEYAGTYPAGWVINGTGDVNGDGKDDLVWMNDQTHQFAYWLMDGAKRIGSRTIASTPGYHPAALGDFDGNGKMDVMWTSSRNDLYVWLGTGTAFSSKYMTTFPAGWRISGRGDLNGDGRDDLIWSTVNGQSWGYWLLNGASATRIDAYEVPAQLNGYAIAASSDTNGDGLTDITWSNGSQAVSWSNQGQCSATTSCTFVDDGSLSLPSGQAIFNSSIPTGAGASP